MKYEDIVLQQEKVIEELSTLNKLLTEEIAQYKAIERNENIKEV